MKTKKIFFPIILSIVLLFGACDDFLENTPNNFIVGSALTEDNLSQLTGPLYNRAWFNFNEKFYFGLGDGMAYNLNGPYSDYIYPFSDLSVNGLTAPLVSAWASLYTVAGRATGVVLTIQASTASQELKNQYIAEARFMRGTAYWYLASLWGNIIIVDNEQELSDSPIVSPNPTKDVYEYAIRDLEFAAKYLPQTAQSGRVTCYSAYGMLSRLYLDYSGYLAAFNAGGGVDKENFTVGTRDTEYLTKARKAAEKVINSGANSLMADYADLFKIENNNNSECLFAFQWVPGLNSDTGYGLINTNQAYFAFGSIVTGDNAAWGGGGTGCPYDMAKEYEEGDYIRRKATWMGNGDFYPEINQANGGLTYDEETFSAAPRWLSVKKGVTGSNKDNPAIGRMNSAYDNYILRLAEVYLNHAEAILGNNASTTDAVALESFNKVRTRAMGISAEKTSITYEDLRHERRVEFCMEGRYWYDLVARSYYQRQEVVNYLNNQNRGEVPPYLFDAPMNLRIDESRTMGTRAVGTATSGTFRLPYPESELLQNPKLRGTPVPFEFTEERIDLFN